MLTTLLFSVFTCLMMQASSGVTSPGKFVDSPSGRQSPDSMSVSGPDGTLLRLPAYSKGAVSIKLAQRGHYEITAQSLFPKFDRRSGLNMAAAEICHQSRRKRPNGLPAPVLRYMKHLCLRRSRKRSAGPATTAARKSGNTFAPGRFYPSGCLRSPSDGSLDPLSDGSVTSPSWWDFPSATIAPRPGRNLGEQQHPSVDSIGNETTFAEAG